MTTTLHNQDACEEPFPSSRGWEGAEWSLAGTSRLGMMKRVCIAGYVCARAGYSVALAIFPTVEDGGGGWLLGCRLSWEERCAGTTSALAGWLEDSCGVAAPGWTFRFWPVGRGQWEGFGGLGFPPITRPALPPPPPLPGCGCGAGVVEPSLQVAGMGRLAAPPKALMRAWEWLAPVWAGLHGDAASGVVRQRTSGGSP